MVSILKGKKLQITIDSVRKKLGIDPYKTRTENNAKIDPVYNRYISFPVFLL